MPCRALPIVKSDLGLMKQAFTSLLSNALKYTCPRSPAMIEVGWSIIDSKTTFYARDNGFGFDPKDAERLFAPFQRLHDDKDFEGQASASSPASASSTNSAATSGPVPNPTRLHLQFHSCRPFSETPQSRR
jgi:hypothetical protein